MEISPESLLSKKFQSVQYYLFILKKRSFQTIKVYLHKKREIIKIIEALYSTKIKKKCFDLLKKSFKQHKEKNKKIKKIRCWQNLFKKNWFLSECKICFWFAKQLFLPWKKGFFCMSLFFSSCNCTFCILISNAACLPTRRAELCKRII